MRSVSIVLSFMVFCFSGLHLVWSHSYIYEATCDKILAVGNTFMGQTTVLDSSKVVVVSRGGNPLTSGDTYIAGETLTLSLSGALTEFAFSVASGSAIFGGFTYYTGYDAGNTGCSGQRVSSWSTTTPTVIMPSSGDVVLRAGTASAFGTLSISDDFILSAPVVTTDIPTTAPILLPTLAPFDAPTGAPVVITSAPVVTTSPSVAPSAVPIATVTPSFAPVVFTVAPSAATTAPTLVPSTAPSLAPSTATAAPSIIPSAAPSTSPSLMPSLAPIAPTAMPTGYPFSVPTVPPSVAPTSEIPSLMPTYGPSVAPGDPSSAPVTQAPSRLPSPAPVFNPVAVPTHRPSTLNAPVLTFKINMLIAGYTGTVASGRILIDSERTVVTSTVCMSMHVLSSNCAMLSADGGVNGLAIVVQTSVHLIDFPEYNNNATALFRDLVRVLNIVRSSGIMDNTLHGYAFSYNANTFSSASIVSLSGTESVITEPEDTGGETKEASSLSTGAIIGIAVGCFMFILFANLIFCFCRVAKDD